MKENWNTRVVGQRVVLVPYRKHHVEKYHAWMQDPELQVGVWFNCPLPEAPCGEIACMDAGS
jgi:hypothetical protein